MQNVHLTWGTEKKFIPRCTFFVMGQCSSLLFYPLRCQTNKNTVLAYSVYPGNVHLHTCTQETNSRTSLSRQTRFAFWEKRMLQKQAIKRECWQALRHFTSTLVSCTPIPDHNFLMFCEWNHEFSYVDCSQSLLSFYINFWFLMKYFTWLYSPLINMLICISRKPQPRSCCPIMQSFIGLI